MPNLYATEDELKAVAPDAIRSTSTQYDSLFVSLAERLSRWIDNYTQREFYPYLETRYFEGDAEDELWIDDLVEITSVSISTDGGTTYTALEDTDYIPMHGDDYNSLKSYTVLKVDINGTLGSWPKGQKSVRVIGTWCFTDNRALFFEDTIDAVNHATGINVTDTTLKLNDVDGADKWGRTPRISSGQILRIEAEQMEVTATDTTTGVQTATVVRGVNGTTAAAHADTKQVDKFMPPEPLKQACIIQAIKQFKRGQVGFGYAEALPDLGRILHIKTIDPEALALLAPYAKLEYG